MLLAMVRADHEPLSPGDVIDRFEVERLLGRGGMGAVYLARDRDGGAARQVALKVLHADSAVETEALQQLAQEAGTLATLSHPHLVCMHETGEAEAARYWALEYVRGETLRDRMAEPLWMAEIVRVALGVASGLAEAHRHGILHRDLRPAKVMLGEDGRARLRDFGLAALLTAERPGRDGTDDPGVPALPLASAGSRRPRYMAPERWLDEPLSGATDVWSLGAMIYEMCVRKPVFEAESLGELLVLHRQRLDPPRISASREVPVALDELVARCLEPKPDARPTAEEVEAALRNMTPADFSEERISAPATLEGAADREAAEAGEAAAPASIPILREDEVRGDSAASGPSSSPMMPLPSIAPVGESSGLALLVALCLVLLLGFGGYMLLAGDDAPAASQEPTRGASSGEPF